MNIKDAIAEVESAAKRCDYEGKLTREALNECADVYLRHCDANGMPHPRNYQRSGDKHRPSHLNEIQWLLVRTPSFRRWFGNSVVVDENGDPKVMYHGSWKDFDKFKPSAIKLSKTLMTLWSGPGFYFADRPDVAKIYAGGEHDRVYEAFLRMNHPLVVDETGNASNGDGIARDAAERIFLDGDNTQWLDSGLASELARMDENEGRKNGGRHYYKGLTRKQRVKEFVSRLKTDVVMLKTAAQAYAAKSQAKLFASICRNTGYDGVIHTLAPEVTEWVVYDPKAIKSANANCGDFDGDDDKTTDAMDSAYNERHNLVEKGTTDMNGFKSLLDSLTKLVGNPAEVHESGMDIVDHLGRHHQPKAIPEGGQYEEEGQYLHGQAKIDAAIRKAGTGKHASLLREHVAPLYAKLGVDSATRAKIQAMHEDIRGLSKHQLLRGMAKHLKDMKRHADAYNEVKDMGKEQFSKWLDAHPEYKTEMTGRLMGLGRYDKHYDVKGGYHDDGTGKQKHEAWEEAKWSVGAKAMASMILFQEHSDALHGAPDAIMANMIDRAGREDGGEIENREAAPQEQIVAQPQEQVNAPEGNANAPAEQAEEQIRADFGFPGQMSEEQRGAWNDAISKGPGGYDQVAGIEHVLRDTFGVNVDLEDVSARDLHTLLRSDISDPESRAKVEGIVNKYRTGGLAKTYSYGGNGGAVGIQVSIGRGVDGTSVSGLNADDGNALALRVRNAMRSSRLGNAGNFEVDVHGADKVNNPRSLDLPVALALAKAGGRMPGAKDIDEYAAIGSLGLNGELSGVRSPSNIVDVRNAVKEAKRIGRRAILVPMELADVASAGITGIDIIPVRTLREATSFLDGSVNINPVYADLDRNPELRQEIEKAEKAAGKPADAAVGEGRVNREVGGGVQDLQRKGGEENAVQKAVNTYVDRNWHDQLGVSRNDMADAIQKIANSLGITPEAAGDYVRYGLTTNKGYDWERTVNALGNHPVAEAIRRGHGAKEVNGNVGNAPNAENHEIQPPQGQQNEVKLKGVAPAMPAKDAVNRAREIMRTAGLKGDPGMFDDGEVNGIGEHWFNLGDSGDNTLQMVIKPNGDIFYGVNGDGDWGYESKDIEETIRKAKEDGIDFRAEANGAQAVQNRDNPVAPAAPEQNPVDANQNGKYDHNKPFGGFLNGDEIKAWHDARNVWGGWKDGEKAREMTLEEYLKGEHPIDEVKEYIARLRNEGAARGQLGNAWNRIADAVARANGLEAEAHPNRQGEAKVDNIIDAEHVDEEAAIRKAPVEAPANAKANDRITGMHIHDAIAEKFRANKVMDALNKRAAELRQDGDIEGADEAEDKAHFQMAYMAALSHFSGKNVMSAKDENGAYPNAGDVIKKMAEYYKGRYDAAVAKYGVDAVENSNRVKGVRAAIQYMAQRIGFHPEFNGGDINVQWGGVENAENQAANPNAGANVAAPNPVAARAPRQPRAKPQAIEFNHHGNIEAVNDQNHPFHAMMNVQPNKAGMPNHYKDARQLKPEHLRSIVDRLPKGLADHRDGTMELKGVDGGWHRVPMADAMEIMLTAPDGTYGRQVIEKMNAYEKRHPGNAMIHRLHEAVNVVYGGNQAGANVNGNANANAAPAPAADPRDDAPVVKPNGNEIENAIQILKQKEPHFGDQLAGALRDMVNNDNPNVAILKQFDVNMRQAVDMLAARIGNDNKVVRYLRKKFNAPEFKEANLNVNNGGLEDMANRPIVPKGQHYELPKTILERQRKGAAEDAQKTDDQLYQEIMHFKHEGTPKAILDEARKRGFEVSDKPLDRDKYYDPKGQYINCYKHFASSILNNFGIKCVPIHWRSNAEGERFYKGLMDYYENVPYDGVAKKAEELAKTGENGTVIYYGTGHANGAILKNGQWYKFDQQAHSMGEKITPEKMQRTGIVAGQRYYGDKLSPVIIRPTDGIAPVIWEMVTPYDPMNPERYKLPAMPRGQGFEGD